MSDEKQVASVLDWAKVLDISQRAKQIFETEGVKMYAMCGVSVWPGLRAMAEERLAAPLVGDVLNIGGTLWMMSVNVKPASIMLVAESDVVVEVPLVIQRAAIEGFDG